MPSVNRSTSNDSSWWPENEPAATGNSKAPVNVATTPPANEAVPFQKPNNDAVAYDGDSRAEDLARTMIARLGENDSLVFNIKGEVKAGESIGAEATATVERQKNGTVTVELGAKGDVGVGAPVAGSARVGVAVGTKLHFATAAEAADFLDAFAKCGVLTSVNPNATQIAEALRKAGFKGDVLDASHRLVGHLDKISEVKGDLTGKVELGDKQSLFGFQELSATADLQLKESFKLNVEEGSFALSQTVSVGGDSKLKIPWILAAGANARGTVTATATYSLTDDQKERVLNGTLTPTALAKELLLTRPELSLKAEVEVGAKGRVGHSAGPDTKAKLSVERKLSQQEYSKATTLGLLHDLGKQKWKAEFEVGIAIGNPKLSAGAASIEASGSYRHKETLKGEFDAFTGAAALQKRIVDADAADLALNLARNNPH